MKYIGAHVSAAGGVRHAPVNASKIGARAFALFTRNQKRWTSPPLADTETHLFQVNLKASGIPVSAVLPHAGYLINPGHPDREKRYKSLKAFVDEVHRAEVLGLQYLNIHPGSHLGLVSEQECFDIIADTISTVLNSSKGVTVVIETTAGQGNSVGYHFEHLAEIIKRIDAQERLGVCIDTAHIFAAGYDIRSAKGYDAVMNEFDRLVGFRFLKGVHLNDSKTPLGSRVDRHACIGKGEIGELAFRKIMNDPRLDGIPLILETPNPDAYREEISMLYRFDKRTRLSNPAER